MIKKISMYLEIYNPRYWIMLNPYCPDLDRILNDMMNDNAPIKKKYYYDGSLCKGIVLFGRKELWVANYPYSYGHFISFDSLESYSSPFNKNKRRAKRKTIYRLHKYIEWELKNNREIVNNNNNVIKFERK